MKYCLSGPSLALMIISCGEDAPKIARELAVHGWTDVLAISNGKVICYSFDPKDGHVLYGIDCGSQREEWHLALENKVVANVLCKNMCYLAIFDGSVIAVDWVSGKLRWSRGVGTTGGAWISYYGDFLYYADGAEIRAIDMQSGDLKWQAKNEIDAGAPAVNQDAVYQAVGESFRALDHLNGKILWEVQTMGASRAPLALAGDWALMPEFGGLIAIDLKKRVVIWRTKLDAAIVKMPVIDSATIILVTKSGFLYSIALHSGEVNWCSKVDGAYFSIPAIATKHAYISTNIALHGIDRKTGKTRLKMVSQGSHEPFSPVVYEGQVYFGGKDKILILSDE